MTTILKSFQELAIRFGARDVYVFGSRADEIATRLAGANTDPPEVPGGLPAADVDIAVIPTDPHAWDPERRVDFTIAMEDLLGVHRVDLVVLPEADPFLALDAIRGELVYTADPDAQARHELYILRRAADLAPFKRERIRMILEGGAR